MKRTSLIFISITFVFFLLGCNNKLEENITDEVHAVDNTLENSRDVDSYLKWKHYKLGYYMRSVAAYDKDSVWLTFSEKDCGVARLKEDGNIEYHLVDAWHHVFDEIDVGSSGRPVVRPSLKPFQEETTTFYSTGVPGKMWKKSTVKGVITDLGVGLYKIRGTGYEKISYIKTKGYNYQYSKSSNKWSKWFSTYLNYHRSIDIDYLENEYYLLHDGTRNNIYIRYNNGSKGELEKDNTYIRDIAVGPYGEIYALGNRNANKYGYPIYKYNASKKSWIYVKRRAKSISVDKYGTLWFVNGAGQLYRSDGVVDAGGVSLCTSKDFDYGGRRVTLGPGSYTKADLEKMKIKINTISSLAVFDWDLKLRLFSKDNFKGSCKTYMSKTYKSELGSWDNRVSSIIIERLSK